MQHRARLGATLVTLAAIAGCRSDRSPSTTDGAKTVAAASATVTVDARDFSFEAPDRIAAGATTFRLTNHGKELHQAQLVKLEDGKTVDDLAKSLRNPGPPPSWIKFVGGPNGIAPGQEANATAVLAPGQYAYLCFIPSADGIMHGAKGMVRPFEVTTASPDAASELPPSDLTIKLVDYDFNPSRPITPGKHTIMVENAGPQPHELVLLKMAPGKKVEDFAHWAESGMKGPPPAEPLGGVVFLEKGGRGTFDVELTPGDYGFLCFVPDTKDGRPHLAHGMMKTIKVG
jgi:plastocyanin